MSRPEEGCAHTGEAAAANRETGPSEHIQDNGDQASHCWGKEVPTWREKTRRILRIGGICGIWFSIASAIRLLGLPYDNTDWWFR